MAKGRRQFNPQQVRIQNSRRKRAQLPKIELRDAEGRWDKQNEDEELWWPRVQWIDPGAVSGLAVVWFDPIALFARQPLARTILAYSEMFLSGPEDGLNGQVNRYMRVRRSLNQTPGLASGCESFTVLSVKQDDDFLSPVRIRAAIQFQMSIEDRFDLEGNKLGVGTELFIQSPADAKNAFTNERLSTLRMYTPGPDHINDAKRHCLLHIRKIGAAGKEAFIRAHGNEEGWWQG